MTEDEKREANRRMSEEEHLKDAAITIGQIDAITLAHYPHRGASKFVQFSHVLKVRDIIAGRVASPYPGAANYLNEVCHGQ